MEWLPGLLTIADDLSVSLVKFHVFSVIGRGHDKRVLGMDPTEWLQFCDELPSIAADHHTRVWYRPTFPLNL